MSKNLVIVESPAKAKTIKKYLGKDFEVVASYGHIRDLVSKDGAVDPANDFRMNYEVTERSEKHVDAILRAMKKADCLYLATDPDREGEAISWHLLELLRERGVLNDKPVHRAKFFEITKKEIQAAIAHPETLSNSLVNAQQARRALDHLIGFNLSPLLWRKMFPGLSAGRVQSVALRLICDREAEIQAFRRQEYWTIDVLADKGGAPFSARVVEVDGKRIEADVGRGAFTLTNEADALAAQASLNKACAGALTVTEVEAKPKQRNPQAPFRTSTLQQAAANRLGYSARRTMQLAQKLYEGLDVGEGPVGLITYMRTDSTSLSDDAIGELRQVIGATYGADSVPAQPRSYANKQKNAQEAHEAIRPTAAATHPDTLKGKIEEDLWRLYDLIWKRTVASQMVNAIFEQVTVNLRPSGRPAAGPGPAAGGAPCCAPPARRSSRRASSRPTAWTSMTVTTVTKTAAVVCRRWPWVIAHACRPLTRNATKPSRPRATPKRRSCGRWKSAASADRRRTPRSSRRCGRANTSMTRAAISYRPIPARWSAASWSSTSPPTWITTSPRASRMTSTTSRAVTRNGSRSCANSGSRSSGWCVSPKKSRAPTLPARSAPTPRADGRSASALANTARSRRSAPATTRKSRNLPA